jgi:hypothetical protein
VTLGKGNRMYSDQGNVWKNNSLFYFQFFTRNNYSSQFKFYMNSDTNRPDPRIRKLRGDGSSGNHQVDNRQRYPWAVQPVWTPIVWWNEVGEFWVGMGGGGWC